MLNELGAKMHYRNTKVTLNKKNVLGFPIFATPDACHLFKLVRNCFGSYQVFEDSNGGKVSWIFIRELQDLQEKEGLFLANKLRRRHVVWEKNKMSTVLAIQLLSNSVADSIDFCRDVLKLKQFVGSEATTFFLRKMDKMFDILNSKSKFDQGLKAPLTKDDDSFKAVFKDTIEYILGLKIPNAKHLVDTPRKAAFIGFIVLMRSVEKMYDLYVLTGHLSYFLTFKISQDHLGLINFDFQSPPNTMDLLLIQKKVIYCFYTLNYKFIIVHTLCSYNNPLITKDDQRTTIDDPIMDLQ